MSVEFGPGGATECHERGHIEDVDEDGDLDMILHFRTQETGIKWDDTEAFLTGQTMDGMVVIEGSDAIMIVPSEGEENGDTSAEAEDEDKDEGPGKGKAKGKSKVKVRGNSNANAEAVDDDEDEDEDGGKGKAIGKGKSRGKAKGKGKKAPVKGGGISPTVWGRMKV